MESIRYRSGRLALRVLGSCIAALALGFLFLHPLGSDEGPSLDIIGLLSTDVGHWLVLPPLFLFNAYLGWFYGSRLGSSHPAVEVKGNELVLDHIWGQKRIPFSQLIRVYERTLRRGLFSRNRWLAFQVQGGGALGYRTHHLSLSVLDISRSQLPRVIEQISQLRDNKEGSAATEQACASDSGFDADAALARYLARLNSESAALKAEGGDEVSAQAGGLDVPQNPLMRTASRPVFGRKSS